MSAVGLWIDWTGSGFGAGAHDDLTQYVTKATYTRGSAPEITGAAQAGHAVFTVQNPGGLFDPDYASGPLYGLLHDGPRVWFGANEDGTLSAGGTVRGRFAGRITEVAPLPVAGAGDSTPLAEIVCEDALGWYGRTPVKLTDDCSPPPPPVFYGYIAEQQYNSELGDAISNGTVLAYLGYATAEWQLVAGDFVQMWISHEAMPSHFYTTDLTPPTTLSVVNVDTYKGARVHATATQTSAATDALGQDLLMVYGAADYDDDSMWNAGVPNRLTINTDGVYAIAALANLNGTGTTLSFERRIIIAVGH